MLGLQITGVRKKNQDVKNVAQSKHFHIRNSYKVVEFLVLLDIRNFVLNFYI